MIMPSTSGFAHGRHLGEVLDELVANGATGVQIAIGPRPYPGDVVKYLSGFSGVEFRAHANCPLGGSLMNQERDFNKILATCAQAGIKSYTVHAPRKKNFPTWKNFLDWATDKLIAAREYGIDFAVETMYPAESPYWLESFEEVWRFTHWAGLMGWWDCMATDVAHLQIGVAQGTWTDEDVEWLLSTDHSLEFHFSDNDGVHDNHKPYSAGVNQRIDRWVNTARGSGLVMIDEGRRRRV